jgi:S-formylglutathione hydrolase FrmB
MPNVHRSFYTDMAGGLRYWTYVSEEVPALARSFFRLSSRREDNFVAGLSMGGYGAFKLALRKPEAFAAAASLSGALDIAARETAPPENLAPDLRRVFGERKVAGSPDDLFFIAAQLARRTDLTLPLFQCCGAEDALYPENVKFRDYARGLGLALTYEEGPGMHEWGYWDRAIQRVLEWLPLRGRAAGPR